MLVDISQPVSPATGAWPGDTPFHVEWTWSLDAGDSCNVSAVRTSPHVGTHADAPRHFLAGGAGIGEVDPEAYVGPCFVVDGPRDGRLVEPGDLEAAWGPGRERILVRTRDEAGGDFPRDFSALSVEAARWLAARGVRLIGLDTPSVDPFASTELPAHRILAAAGVAILENLVLAHVPPGPWELIAPPLRWEGLDASPVRALLRGIGS